MLVYVNHGWEDIVKYLFLKREFVLNPWNLTYLHLHCLEMLHTKHFAERLECIELDVIFEQSVKYCVEVFDEVLYCLL